ncbi:MAG: DinB family protein [Thiobacillus sp.]|nr:DinB family protein [Thiobacillus sp.]
MYSWKTHFVSQADYQHWANEVMFTALDHFQPEVIGSDQGLFFRSIHHTVDHMLVVSQAWLARLKGESFSPDYKVINHPDWRELKLALRKEMRHLQDWLDTRPEGFYEGHIRFSGSDGKPREMWTRDALIHLFTHYAHHRGQVSAVATRLGGPCPEMDFVYYRREMDKLMAEAQAEARQAKDQ